MASEVTVAVISGFVTLCASIIAAYTTVKVTKLKDQKRMDLSEGMELQDKVQGIIDDLRFNLDADRVTIWYGSNGDVTFGLHHLKKMSVTNESNRDGIDNIREDCQLIPIAVFERQIRDLRNKEQDEVLLSDELALADTLARLNKKHGNNYIAYSKLYAKRNKWAGLLIVSWKEKKALSEGDFFDIVLASEKISTT